MFMHYDAINKTPKFQLNRKRCAFNGNDAHNWRNEYFLKVIFMLFSGSANYMLLFSTLYFNKIQKTTQIPNKLLKEMTFHINTNSEGILFYWIVLLTELTSNQHYPGLRARYISA